MDDNMDTNKMKRNLAGKSLVGQAGMTLLEILIVLAIIALVMGFLFGPRLLEMLGESKKERAGILVDEFANKAYTQWILNNPGKHCPDNLGELARYTNHEDTKDPWGNEFVMVCGDSAPDGVPNRMGVISMGEDGKPDTDDDIRSWGKKK